MSKRIINILLGAGLLVGAAGATALGPDEGAGVRRASYVGAETCKKCHYQTHRTWVDEGHAKAWENLPEAYRDPAVVDEEGRACISCHVTGWGQPDGFVDPVTSKHLLGVQCEACHGPGSRHVELGRQMIRDRRDAFAPGEQTWIVLRTTGCVDCHEPHVSYDHY